MFRHSICCGYNVISVLYMRIILTLNLMSKCMIYRIYSGNEKRTCIMSAGWAGAAPSNRYTTRKCVYIQLQDTYGTYCVKK